MYLQCKRGLSNNAIGVQDRWIMQEDIDNGYARYDSRMTLGRSKYIDTNKDGKN